MEHSGRKKWKNRALIGGSLACAFAGIAVTGALAVGVSPDASPAANSAAPARRASPPSEEEAYSQKVMDRTQPILQLLEEAYPDFYSGAQVEYDDRAFIIFAKKQRPPAEVQDLIDAVPEDLVAIEWRVTKFSQKDLRAAMNALPDLEGVSLVGPAPDASSIQAYVAQGVDTRNYPSVIDGVPIEYFVLEGQLNLA